jgi:hypothetical protein
MLSIIGRYQVAVDAAPRLVRKEIFSRMKWDSITCVEEFDNDTYKGKYGPIYSVNKIANMR